MLTLIFCSKELGYLFSLNGLSFSLSHSLSHLYLTSNNKKYNTHGKSISSLISCIGGAIDSLTHHKWIVHNHLDNRLCLRLQGVVQLGILKTSIIRELYGYLFNEQDDDISNYERLLINPNGVYSIRES